MTVDGLIARQMRVSHQDKSHCDSVSLDRDCANAFHHYVNQSLAFAVKRGGFMYGTVTEQGQVEVDFIYEPPQQGTEANLILMRDAQEEKRVDAIAMGLGMRKVGFIFNQTVVKDKTGYTLSNAEVVQAAELHAESELQEWVTAVVKLEVNEDVHLEAFQMSDMCIRLFKEGWLETEIAPDDDPKLSMNKEVVLGVKDVKEVDNDFFLVVVEILDHQGPLSSTFPIENRSSRATMRALKTHLDRELALGEDDLRFSSASLCGSVSGRVIGRPCLSRVCASAVTCSGGLCVAHRINGQHLLICFVRPLLISIIGFSF